MAIFNKGRLLSPATVNPVDYPLIPANFALVATVIAPQMQQGPWIAGGAVLAWQTNDPFNEDRDIDVFCASRQQADHVINQLKSALNYSTVFTSKNAVTLNCLVLSDTVNKDQQRLPKVQIILKKFYNSAAAVIESFDITVCQLVTDGYRLQFGNRTWQDIRQRQLKFTLPYREGIMGRYVKYMSYGYRPSKNEIEKITDQIAANDLAAGEFAYDTI